MPEDTSELSLEKYQEMAKLTVLLCYQLDLLRDASLQEDTKLSHAVQRSVEIRDGWLRDKVLLDEAFRAFQTLQIFRRAPAGSPRSEE